VKRWVDLLVIGVILAAHVSRAPAAAAQPIVIDAALWRVMARTPIDQPLDVIITLRDQASLASLDRASVPDVLRRHAAAAQSDVLAWLRTRPAGHVTAVSSLWITNAIALSASRDVILEAAARADIARIQLDVVISAPDQAPAPAAPNLNSLGVPAVWQRGITGHGVVVAILDSGADLHNIDLKRKWRGGANSWYDPYGEHETPVDITGHGTQMLGVILGGVADAGVAIGLAPDARWIAARIFNDRGRATTSAIHKALQWVLDPDGDPTTADAPQVVNNSWSVANPGCDPDFAPDLRALRAAGILPVFAAGADQPVSPANLPEAFAVGAIDDRSGQLIDSARGPSDCLRADGVYPQLVAPGVDIHTLNRSGGIIEASGTSLAAAHVSGALALLLSARPGLSADEQAALLTDTAVDLGARGPDNDFGYGRLDVAALIDRAVPDHMPGLAGVLITVGALTLASLVLIVRRRVSPPVTNALHRAASRPTSNWQDLDS
jgi:subtilisin family serine protease